MTKAFWVIALILVVSIMAGEAAIITSVSGKTKASEKITKDMGQLNYPLSYEDQKILQEVVNKFGPDIVFNAMWDSVVRYTTFFESLDGYDAQNAVFNGTNVELDIPGVLGQSAYIAKKPSYQGFFSFNARSYFRTSIMLANGAATSAQAKIVIGSATEDGAGGYSVNNCYGFKVVNGVLYGLAGDGTSETTLKLATLAESTQYSLVAKFFPASKKVVFYVEGIEKGNITTTLPTSAATTAEPNFFKISGTNGAGVAGKTISFSLFDYIQDRAKPFAQ